jgi:hypothetical protein
MMAGGKRPVRVLVQDDATVGEGALNGLTQPQACHERILSPRGRPQVGKLATMELGGN